DRGFVVRAVIDVAAAVEIQLRRVRGLAVNYEVTQTVRTALAADDALIIGRTRARKQLEQGNIGAALKGHLRDLFGLNRLVPDGGFSGQGHSFRRDVHNGRGTRAEFQHDFAQRQVLE